MYFLVKGGVYLDRDVFFSFFFLSINFGEGRAKGVVRSNSY